MTKLPTAWRSLPVAGRLRLVVLATVVAAFGCAVVATLAVLLEPSVPAWRLALIAALLPLSEAALLHVRLGGDSVSFTWGEGCVLVGFATISPAWLVLLAGPCVLGVHLVKGRGLLKAAFNAASFTVATAVGAALLGGLSPGPYTVSRLPDVLALSVAVLAFSLVSVLQTSMVVGVAQGVPMRRVLRQNLRMVGLVYVGNMVCGGAVLYLDERTTSTLLVLPPLLLVVFFLYRGYLRANQERDIWQQLEAATRELNHLDETRVAHSVLARAKDLFRANDALLVLSATQDRPARSYALDRDQVMCAAAEPLQGSAGTTTIATFPSAGSRRPSSTVLLTTLQGSEQTVGELRLTFNGSVRLNRREQQVLTTFAHSVAVTLVNAALHDSSQLEAQRHAHQASHDHLTGLANRVHLYDQVERCLSLDQGTTALLLLDLDHFKQVNDTLGHAAGDVLLQHVSARLLEAVGDASVVARLGGDEFAVLLTGLDSPSDAGVLAGEILARLTSPVDYQGLHLSIEASLGVACHPQDAADANGLFQRADVAMYQAKSERGSWLRYDALRDDSSVERLSLVSELRTALDEHQLFVEFQPQYDLSTNTLIGAEALVRWNHPTRGLLQPGAFVDVAEQSALVRPFTLRVLDLAVAECVRWQSSSRTPSVAVNVGARSLMDDQLPDDVAAVLARHGLPAHRLVLEITETTATSELGVVEDVLGRLRRLGVEISVDDFGTGFSSLAFLQRTAVHELKVDRSFVSGMLTTDNDRALVRATVQLAHALGARAVAEGVESQALLIALASMGCDVAQGFHLGRPMRAEDLRALLSVPAPRDGERHLNVV